jgi:hypothetical protein
MIGNFQRGVHPLKDALPFENERGLTSTAGPLPANNDLMLLASRMLDLRLSPKSAETRSHSHAH